MIYDKKYRKLFSLVKKYYILIFILLILLFIGSIAGYRLFFQQQTYVYVKIKVSQGLWWAVTAKPSIWYVESIYKGDSSYDMFGNKKIEIVDKKIFLSAEKNEYDIFLTLRMLVNGNKNTQTYTFNRDVLAVGTPLEIQFPKENITGTIIAVQNTPFTNHMIEKTVYLYKRYAYPWEYDAIHRGSSLFDGQKNIVTVLDKSMQETTSTTFDFYGNSTVENRAYITIKAKMKVKQVGTMYVLGEEILLQPGRIVNISLSDFALQNYIVGKIE